MCVQLLNVANPVRPEVKLEAEREICKVMGWDKVILPTQDEYNKKAEEQDKLQKQLAEKKLKESQPQDGTSTDRGEKVQGPPQPQNEDMLQKRLEKGVNVRQSISKKGKSRPMGDTRMSKEVVQETVTDEEKPPQRVEITFKHEPQRIELSPVKTEVIVKTETPLDDIMKELVKKNETLVDMRTRLNEEENKRKQEKLRKEIGKLETEINGIEKRIEFEQQKAQTEIDETKKTEEKKREVLEKNEQEKTKAEIEEKRKTEEKKRETLEKINKTINEEQEMIEGKGDSE